MAQQQLCRGAVLLARTTTPSPVKQPVIDSEMSALVALGLFLALFLSLEPRRIRIRGFPSLSAAPQLNEPPPPPRTRTPIQPHNTPWPRQRPKTYVHNTGRVAGSSIIDQTVRGFSCSAVYCICSPLRFLGIFRHLPPRASRLGVHRSSRTPSICGDRLSSTFSPSQLSMLFLLVSFRSVYCTCEIYLVVPLLTHVRLSSPILLMNLGSVPAPETCCVSAQTRSPAHSRPPSLRSHSQEHPRL